MVRKNVKRTSWGTTTEHWFKNHLEYEYGILTKIKLPKGI